MQTKIRLQLIYSVWKHEITRIIWLLPINYDNMGIYHHWFNSYYRQVAYVKSILLEWDDLIFSYSAFDMIGSPFKISLG